METGGLSQKYEAKTRLFADLRKTATRHEYQIISGTKIYSLIFFFPES